VCDHSKVTLLKSDNQIIPTSLALIAQISTIRRAAKVATVRVQ
jgi:hypothetical protein